MKLIRAKLREWSLDERLAQNVASLYGVQFASYLLPLITIPYLTRVLGASTWGLVAFAQAFGAYVNLAIEYGFNLSATREVAKNRDSKNELSALLSGVLGAKFLLAACAAGVAVLVGRWVPIFREHPVFLWAGMFWALAQSFSMLWYYQGFEKMRFVAVLDMLAKTVATAGIFIIVHRPSDGWKVLGLQGAGALLSVMVAMVCVCREVPLRLPGLPLVWKTLRMGWSMFVYRSSLSLYGVGNPFILGLFVPPEAVGFYAGAERIIRAFMGLLAPVHQSLYPRLSNLVRRNRAGAKRLVRASLLLMSSAGIASSLTVFLAAPWIVHIILGKGFAASVPVLRVMAPLPFLDAVSTVLGLLWMLPLGMDRQFNATVLIAGAINLALALALAPHFAEVGMACAVVTAEVFATLSIYILLHWQGLNPLALSPKEPEPLDLH